MIILVTSGRLSIIFGVSGVQYSIGDDEDEDIFECVIMILFRISSRNREVVRISVSDFFDLRIKTHRMVFPSWCDGRSVCGYVY